MTWDRRRVWRLLAPAAAMLCLGAFSPRNLDTWRQHSLFLLFRDGDHADREAAALVTARLAEKLPDSRAQPLPVPELHQIGELLLSRQFDVALLVTADAEAIDRWAATSAGAQSEPLVLLARIGAHLLICRADLAAGHAVMIAAALADLSPKDATAPVPPLAWHSAVRR
jgi:hypothetical protein